MYSFKLLLPLLIFVFLSNTSECRTAANFKLISDFEKSNNSVGLEDINYRLPRSLWPNQYNLYLHPDLETGLFTGRVIINLSVLESTRTITLHSYLLTIEEIEVQNNSGIELEVSDHQLDTLREFLVIDMVEELKANETIELTIFFSGYMEGKIQGLYSSYYTMAEKRTKSIATSKFEPTYARQAFPCFDEPDMKAPFTVTLVRPTDSGYNALSNMNIINSKPVGVETEVYFAESVPMSTYLVCFLISDFVPSTAQVNGSGIGHNFDLRIFATKPQLGKVSFALETAVAAAQFYIQYFKVEYPLPKLDMAAIPDFASNAMENWGLVTYRETALLYDPAFSSTWNKQRVAIVVAHELAHMWFGNLVTLKWWNDLWLNEGFARFMEYKSLQQIYGSWGLPEQFLIVVQQPVFDKDASSASHPILQIVESPDQIGAIFDSINYDKGASIIRMLEDLIGAEKFANAVTSYLTKYKFKNAITDDFISEVVQQYFDFDVQLMLRTWTEQMGFPVVEVNRTSPTEFTVHQKRFLSNFDEYQGVYNDSPFNYRWTIPITYFSNSDVSTVHRMWFGHNEASLTINVPEETKWLKLNARQVGYYRVNYDTNTWQNIIADMITDPSKFPISDRAHILNDVFALADAGQLSYDTALNLLQYLSREKDFVPWYVAANKMKALSDALKYTDVYVEYLKFARHLMTGVYREVTWNIDEENHLQNRLRVTILTTACGLGLPECLKEASVRFNDWLDNVENIPSPDLREIVYYYGMQQGGTETIWNKVWERFLNEEDASEKLKLMYGLSGVRTPWILNKFIRLAANENYIRRQDYFDCLAYIAENPAGEPLIWDFVRENWTKLTERYGLSDRYLAKLMPPITSHFDSETKLEEMLEFFGKYPKAGAGEAGRSQSLAAVRKNVRWLKENKKQIKNWLLEQQ